MLTLLSLVLVLALGLLQPTPVCALTGQQIAFALQAELSSGSEVVLTSNTSAYPAKNFTPRYNIATPPTYTVAVKPALAVDVQKVVQYALHNNASFLATGSGHGYSTSLDRLQAGIDLDLGFFNSIEIDTVAKTMTIGGSVSSNDLASALQAAGMEATLGQCGCIGYPGASLGGGIGPYSGLYGPMSDSLLSAEIITGRGQLLNVSSTQHPDLFYGLKGAGFNFGVATSLTYRIYPATNGGNAMLAQMIFPGALNQSVWQIVSNFTASNQPKELAIGLDARYVAAMGGMVVMANFIYIGPQSAGMKVIQPFLDLKPANLNISTVAWADIPFKAFYGGIAEGGCTAGAYYVPHSLNLYQIDVPNLVEVFNYMNKTLATNEVLQGVAIAMQQYAQYGFQLQDAKTSAWPYRDVVSFVQIDGVATNPSQLPAVGKYGRKIRDRLHHGSGRKDLQTYVHFANGNESPAALYSAAKLPGLRALKREYDPARLFSWYNPI
ncbi:hypothetical protein BGW36DRAFT_427229 [Talaromyces proteolyticus]|uniref:FAD-binding PCMH-type domain-containing protein n=1 Tax=Talaromyces proteolyticus TaxID=1131652 RepID=A0AAD4Q0J8_9EURO|nr:uncharacterized protein BGW36DRAFT_427229 [Talaromyces proteolyticus]KAH8697263.1 hypothetical protein BGW36DRAFT_427229 [Talaromyces proteolyticus]